MTAVFNRIGPYEIQKEVGRGGMAVVFLATDTRTAIPVALKLVPEGSDREAREIFEAEKLGAELQKQFCRVSPRVPTVYEHGVESGYFYVAMEYLDGENISDTIARGPLEVARAVSIANDLCSFLEEAHGFDVRIGDQDFRSLLHGDLTSRNVRLTSTQQVKVLDFGIAKALSLSRKVTRNDFGSRSYLSPERLESGVVDKYADFWAVGVLLYEMLQGETPFQAPDTRRLEQRIISRQPPPTLEARCPIGLQAIVAKLLAPNQAGRYESAHTIREDLDRYRSGVETIAEREGWPTRTVDEVTRRTRPHTTVVVPPLPDVSSIRQPAPVADGTRRTPSPPKRTRIFRRPSLRTALLLLALIIAVNEIMVARAAGRIAGIVPTRGLDALDDMWSRYDQLSERSFLNVGTVALQRSLTRHTQALADRTIENYRNGLSTVRERQWQIARDALAHAVAIAPESSRLRAALRYCEGHLHRINGDARKERDQIDEARQEFADAIASFREAAQLRPQWPDPFLGLARTFIYGMGDVDRGADALARAESLGYMPGDRETIQLGDGYRERGATLARNARQVADMPQEQEHLARAAEVYRRALELYSKIAHVPDVPRRMRLTQRGLEQVQRRIDELSQPAIFEPVPESDSSSGDALEEQSL